MFESILAFFTITILTGAWFWVAAVGLFILILALEETDHYFFAGLSVLAFVWIMEQSGVINIFTSPLTVLYWGAIYMAIGAGWSFIKWFSFLHKQGDKLSKLKPKWIEGQNKETQQHNDRNKDDVSFEPQEMLAVSLGTKVPAHYLETYKEFLSNQGYLRSRSDKIIPQISDNKARITSWIVWWPWSALWTVLNDPIRRLAEFMYERLQTSYQAVANHVFAKFQVEDEG